MFTLLADLLGAEPISNRKEQFTKLTVDHAKETGLRQQLFTQVLVGPEYAQQAVAFRQACEQIGKVPNEPAVKRAEVPTFQGKQDANRRQFARIEFGLTVLRHGFHLVIN